MKKVSYFIYIVVLGLAFWILLFVYKMFQWPGHNLIGEFASRMEVIVNFLIILPTLKIYKSMNKENQNIFIFLTINNVGLMFSDIAWYSITYLNRLNPHHFREIPLLVDVIPFYIWTLSIIFFLWKLLNKYILQHKHRIKISLGFVIIDIVSILLFFSSIHYAGEVFSGSTLLKIIFFITYLIVFDFAILVMIYAESQGLILFLSGTIILLSGDFFLMYATFPPIPIHLHSYGELLFLLGLLFNLFGVLKIYKDQDYEIKNWVRRDTAIKSKLTFWCFAGGITSFLLFFMLAYIFDVISQDVFSILPLSIMIYSIVIVMLSLYLGKYFEMPFKQLANNIKLLIMADKNKQMDGSFSTEEFNFLQGFIIEAFKYRAEKDQAQLEAEKLKYANETQNAAFKEQEKFRITVGQMVHDIQSPLSSLSTIIEEQSSSLPENTRVTLRNAKNRINDITNNIFRKYENKDIVKDESMPLLVHLALIQVLSEKRYEYSKSKITFDMDVEKDANFIFIKINPSDFKRMISNVINNAAEAVQNKDNGTVKLELCTAQNNAVIIIRDNGYGMPEHIVNKFYQGVPVTEGKETGHGIGLTQVRDVIALYSGKCKIHATQNIGTKVVFRFPLVIAPQWMSSEIKLTNEDIVVILDDDNSAHDAWENKFKFILEKFPSLQIKYFTFAKEAIDYIHKLDNEQKENIFLLTDYELLDQGMSGIDVVKNTGIKRAILVTSHASHSEIQEMVLQAGIKAIPKELTHAISITVDKKIPKWSRAVDMVWVEDQKTFVDDMVHEFYSHLKVDVYYEPDGFMTDVNQYPLDTRFILDTNYYTEDGKAYILDGVAIAKKLYDMGYTKLILFAGQAIKQEETPPYLTVILKNDLEKRKNLDKI